MSLANSVRVTYHGEVLALIDQAEVKAVEPYIYVKPKPLNLFKRVCGWFARFLTGDSQVHHSEDQRETFTKVSFKDGTWARVRMPFHEFVATYC